MLPPALQCSMPKMALSGPSLDMLPAKNITFKHKTMIADKQRADTWQQQQQQKEHTLSTCVARHCCCQVSVACCLSAIMLFSTNKVFLACSMSKDGLEGAIFGMEHWRVSGDIHRKFYSLLLTFSGQKRQNSTASGMALLSTHHT